MQKIVIVKGCGNSFSLSTKMLTRYFELSNLPKPYFYERKFSHSVNIHSEYIRVDNLDNYFYNFIIRPITNILTKSKDFILKIGENGETQFDINVSEENDE